MIMKYIQKWYRAHFSNNEAAIFLFITFLFLLIIIFIGDILAPVFASIVIAFLLESLVKVLQRYTKISRGPLVFVVYIAFLAILLAFIFIVLPLFIQQLVSLVKNVPSMIEAGRQWLVRLSHEYPHIISKEQLQEVFSSISSASAFEKLVNHTTDIINYSIYSISSLFTYVVYLFLVPLLVLFFLKDKEIILRWVLRYLPKERGALVQVWHDLKPQLANYMKGKAVEMIIVTIATYIGLIVFGMNYALLLSLCVGFSVVIPYIGMVLVTIPVVIIGLMQYGLSPDFFYMFIVFLIIQGLDGNLLVPILYSEAVSLHPVAVIISVLFFGSIWGFWGLFFAIPLAALIKAGIKICTGTEVNQ